jgi:hypothetical protein
MQGLVIAVIADSSAHAWQQNMYKTNVNEIHERIQRELLISRDERR